MNILVSNFRSRARERRLSIIHIAARLRISIHLLQLLRVPQLVIRSSDMNDIKSTFNRHLRTLPPNIHTIVAASSNRTIGLDSAILRRISTDISVRLRHHKGIRMVLIITRTNVRQNIRLIRRLARVLLGR